MGCICSTVRSNHEARELESSKSTLHLIPTPSISQHLRSFSADVSVSLHRPSISADNKTVIVAMPSRTPSRRVTPDALQSRVLTLPHPHDPHLTSAGWPSWLASVAPDATKDWVPRCAESFQKLDKVGQGTYSSVYKAKDLETGKLVAMKKVRFVNMDPESVRFMAREIQILRKLDHPNVMKLEGLATSRLSGSLYLVFEYMEHDLAGLAATPGIRFTEPQIKCYMQQLFRGLQHCHRRGILHRDIKGSNLLINNDGILKIGDFGLANFYRGDQVQPLTSRVVTLWYRAPELLLGATEYGPAIDLWSAGCILAELFAGKPIMPGRTEVEQMHKIFKLCGSPSEDYWQRTKLPLARSFRPHQPYKRALAETFTNFPPSALALVDKLLAVEAEKRGSAASALRSEFFVTELLPASPASLPKYPPSKELDAKLRNEEARKKKAEDIKGRGTGTVRRGRPEDLKLPQTPEFIGAGQSKATSINYKFKMHEEGRASFRIEPARRSIQHNGYVYAHHATSMIHPMVVGSSWNRGGSTIRQGNSQAGDLSGSSHRRKASRDSAIGCTPMKNRIHFSGPLMPPGGNIEDMLKEHERQIQQAVRKSHIEKSAAKKNQGLTGQQRFTGRYAH